MGKEISQKSESTKITACEASLPAKAAQKLAL